MPLSKYAKLVNLHIKKKKEEAKVIKVKEAIKDLEAGLLDEMVEDGLTHANTTRGNLRVSRMVRASAGGDMPALIAAMEAAGKGDMVKDTVSGTALGAWVREYDPGNVLSPEEITKKLPAPLRKAIKVTETITIKVTLKKG
jgi:hypothetical protein